MRIAYLNNHATACRFIVKEAARYGCNVYIPVIAHEQGALASNEARAVRTLDLESLDDLDIYSDLFPAQRHMDALEQCHLIIVPGAVRSGCLLFLAQKLATNVLILEWGDVGNTRVHFEYNIALSRRNCLRAVCYSSLDPYAFHLPLGCDFTLLDNALRANRQRKSTNYVCLIASRLYRDGYTFSKVTKMLNRVHSTSLDLVIMGKEIPAASGEFLKQTYSDRWRGIASYSDLPTSEFYGTLANSQALLYWMDEETVLQYSAIEANYLGVPIVSLNSSLVTKYLQADDPLVIPRGSKSVDMEMLLHQKKSQDVCHKIFVGLDNWGKLLSDERALETVFLRNASEILK